MVCTRAGVGRQVYTGVAQAQVVHPWVHLRPHLHPLIRASSPAHAEVPAEDSLGSEVSYSLGRVSWRLLWSSSRQEVRRILTREESGVRDDFGQQLDSTRAKWPLITLGLDSRGETRKLTDS